MTLPTWYRIHAMVTIPFALPMVLVPRWFIELITKGDVSALGRWITVGFFGVFALGYFWFGFVKGRLEPATR